MTGSHNPPDYNGLKMVIAGETLSGEAIQALRERIERASSSQGEASNAADVGERTSSASRTTLGWPVQ